ncbi:MAG TPA: polymer-forming cytoskeletal protein [Chloroflexota bacterium]|nr:polymer-forming cytoskeletal protein [Chloroflexota bacterium]
MREALRPAERYSSHPEPEPAVVPPVSVNPPSKLPELESEMIPDVDNASVVSLGSVWQGSLKIEGSVKIEGQVTGEVEAKKMVFVAEGAQVDAKVKAALVVIAGEFKGEVFCSERLEIKPTGRVNAALTTKSLEVHEGAFIEGQIHMTELEAKPAPATNGKAAVKPAEIPFKPVTISTN